MTVRAVLIARIPLTQRKRRASPSAPVEVAPKRESVAPARTPSNLAEPVTHAAWVRDVDTRAGVETRLLGPLHTGKPGRPKFMGAPGYANPLAPRQLVSDSVAEGEKWQHRGLVPSRVKMERAAPGFDNYLERVPWARIVIDNRAFSRGCTAPDRGDVEPFRSMLVEGELTTRRAQQVIGVVGHPWRE